MGCAVSSNLGQQKCTQRHIRYQWVSQRNGIKAKPLNLSQMEVKLVKTEWNKLIADTEGQVGLILLRWIFQKNPSIKRLFGLDSVSNEVLETHPKVIRHGLLLQDTLILIVESLSTTNDYLASMLVTFGSYHAHITRRGFDPLYWYAFGDSLLEVIQRNQSKVRLKRLISAWSKVVKFIIGCMQIGHANQRPANVAESSRKSLKMAVLESDGFLLFGKKYSPMGLSAPLELHVIDSVQRQMLMEENVER